MSAPPEPSVLERCRCQTREHEVTGEIQLLAPPEGCPMHSWLGTAHRLLVKEGHEREAQAVADAIAEIERTGRALVDLNYMWGHQKNINAELQAKLREF